MGLVPSSPRLPPAGATQAWLGVMARAATPIAVNCSISGHKAEKWKQLLMTRAATPTALAFSASNGAARSKASGE
ncbi:hypothetical protein D3C77_365510 [compost metagenome]